MCVGSGSAHIFSVEVGCWFSQKKKRKEKSVDEFYIDRNRFPSFLGARRIGSQFSDGLFVDFIRSAPASHPEHLPSFHFASSRFVLFFSFVLEYWWKSARRVLRQLANNKQNKILYGLDFGMYSGETLYDTAMTSFSLCDRKKSKLFTLAYAKHQQESIYLHYCWTGVSIVT